MPFQNPQLPLMDLLRDVRHGKLQLPDFQREYKWDDDRIRSLLSTLTLGHPMGVIMILETGGDETRFKPRPISGAAVDGDKEPDHLLLDGQQRMTSLFQALGSGRPVETTDSRKKRLRRWYYLDVDLALGDPADRDEAVVSVPEDRVMRSDFGRHVDLDLTSRANEVRAAMFPLDLAYNTGEAMGWLAAYLIEGDEQSRAERLGIFQRFQAEVLTPMHSYAVPAIELPKETTKEAVCTVFEKVNTGGLALNVFELLTAMFAGNKAYYDKRGHDFRLNEEWEALRKRLATKPVLRSVQSSDFLQGITLLVSRERRESARLAGTTGKELPAITARRADILKLQLTEYEERARPLEEAFMWAADFLAGEHIFHANDLPYRTQLVPLACLRVLIGKGIDTYGTAARIRQWYWCGVLGEQYGGSVETRFARDVERVPVWATDQSAPVPETVSSAGFRESRLLSLKTRNSSAYKGVHALLMRNGANDWAKNVEMGMANFVTLNVDIHHVFPYAWCQSHDIDSNQRDSIINKTPLSAETNRRIGGRAPSGYLKSLETHTGLEAAQLDKLVAGHHIDTDALRADDFEGFFSRRMNALVGLIEEATGKTVVRDLSQPDPTPTAASNDLPEQYETESDDTGDAALAELLTEEEDRGASWP